MTHDETAVRQAHQERWENLRVIRSGIEAVGSGKARIEFNAQPFGLAPESEAQNVQCQRFSVLQTPGRLGAGALSHPGFGRSLRDDPEKSVAYLRKQMNVLVAVDEIRSSSEHIDKSA